ncbi:MAG TPA: hypothetical protein VMS98_18355 [Thermoanaerobaculia bacterium]|nr:hypothetical protein [Thermoanaerobaculia bacterium]
MRSALVVLALSLTQPAQAADLVVRHAFQSTVPRGAVRKVVVEIPSGHITIRNGAADLLSVSGQATREPDGPRSVAKQQRIVDDITVEIYSSNDESIVRRRFGPNASNFTGQTFTSYKLLLDLPPDVDVVLLTRAGEIDIDGTFGNIEVNLRAGEVRVRTPHQGVRQLNASCRAGEIRANLGAETLTRSGLFPRSIRYRNASGHSTVDLHVTAGEIDVVLSPSP